MSNLYCCVFGYILNTIEEDSEAIHYEWAWELKELFPTSHFLLLLSWTYSVLVPNPLNFGQTDVTGTMTYVMPCLIEG